MERKYYIDNLRWICIALLIPYHAAMAYNSWGEGNYILLGSNKILSSFIVFVSPWFMTLLFLLAGMSAWYSMKRRSMRQFIFERTLKLMFPLIFGTLFTVPFLSYIADKTNCGYTGGYFQHLSVFFTKWTDISGYDGGFTIAHLWFLLYLFVISLTVCLFDLFLGKYIGKLNMKKIPVFVAVLFVLSAMAAYPVKVGGKSIATFFMLYLVGFYILSEESVIERTAKFKWFFVVTWIALSVFNVWLFVWTDYDMSVLNAVLNLFAGCFGILSLLTIGSCFIDKENKITRFLSSVSFSVYIVHFVWVVVFEYWFSRINCNVAFIFFFSTLCAFVMTFVTCAIIKYCPVLNLYY